MKMSKNEQWVLAYLGEHPGYHSPSSIGVSHGAEAGSNSFAHHSSWASPVCKRLVEKGLVERNEKGHYRIKS